MQLATRWSLGSERLLTPEPRFRDLEIWLGGWPRPDLAEPDWHEKVFRHQVATITTVIQDSKDTGTACARIVRRVLVHPAARIEAVGVGGVFVPHGQRGRGVGRRFLQRLIQYIHAVYGSRPIVLYHKHGETLYERLGFRRLWIHDRDKHGNPAHWLSALEDRGLIEINGDAGWTLEPNLYF